MEETHIVTVDLGTHKLGVGVCRIVPDGRPEVIVYNDYPSKGISHGKVLNPTKLGEALRSALDRTEEALGMKITQAEVNLQKFDIHEVDFTFKTDITSGMGITSDDVDNLCDMAWGQAGNLSDGEEVFAMVPQCYETEDELGVGADDIVGMVSPTLSGKYKVYLGKRSMRRNIEDAFNIAGVNVRTVFVPEKVGEAVLTQTQMEGGVALIDMGAGATSVSVFFGGALRHYGAVPFGGDSITADVRNVCRIDETLAENIKMGFGGCMPDRLGSLGEKTLKIGNSLGPGKIEVTTKYLSEIITARVQEILDAMFWEIQQSGYADKLKHGIVVVGGCASMFNLCQMIRHTSGYSAKVGAPLKKQINAKSEFFYPGAAASAGLVMDFTPKGCNECTDPSQKVESQKEKEENAPGELFSNRQLEEAGGKKEKERKEKEKKEKKEKEKKDKGSSLGRLFGDLLFGDEDNNDNKL